MSALTKPNDISQRTGDEISIQAAAVKNYRGGAAGVIIGTGYATPLVVATDAMQFIGVYLEGNDNSAGVAGSGTGPVGINRLSGYGSFVRIARRGVWCFDQSGLTQANVGKPVFFTDDHTVSATPGAILAGDVVTVDDPNSITGTAGKAWVDITRAVWPLGREFVQSIAASGAIGPRNPGTFVITKAGVAAMTLAAPTATTDDGVVMTLTSFTANAHTLTATGLLLTGTANVNVATFAAQAGAGLCLMAFNGKWIVLSSVGITFS